MARRDRARERATRNEIGKMSQVWRAPQASHCKRWKDPGVLEQSRHVI